MEPYDEPPQPAAPPCVPRARDTTPDAIIDRNQLPSVPTPPPPVPEMQEPAPVDPPAPTEPAATWPPPFVLDITAKQSNRVRARTVILATVAALLLTAVGTLAVVARHQASDKLTARRKLATASDQLNVASQQLGRSSSELATTQSSLAVTQTRAQTAEDVLGQVRANEVDFIAPYLVDQSTTLDQARCIVNGVIDRLGLVPVLRYDHGPTPAQMPPELARAIDEAAAACVPGAPTA